MVAKHDLRQWVTIDKSALSSANTQQPKSRRTRPATAAGAKALVVAVSPQQKKDALDRQNERTQELRSLKNDLKKYKDKWQNSKIEVQRMTDLMKTKNTVLEKAQLKNEETQQELEQTKKVLVEYDTALKNSSTVCRASLNQELVAATEKMIKTVLFRTWKFLEDEADVVAATEETYEWLEKIPGYQICVTKEEYAAQYKVLFQKAFADSRQYVQSECKKRLKGEHWQCFKHNTHKAKHLTSCSCSSLSCHTSLFPCTQRVVHGPQWQHPHCAKHLGLVGPRHRSTDHRRPTTAVVVL